MDGKLYVIQNGSGTRMMKKEIMQHVEGIMPSLIKDIKTVCSIDSRRDTATETEPFGKRVVDCLNATLEIAKQMGFKTENVDNIVGVVEYGPDTEEYIGIVGHLDVVDINGVWKTDPFECVEKDGYLYARGVLDNKGPMMCCLYALKTMVDLGYSFPMKVKLLFGTNEETGMADMVEYFKTHSYPTYGWTPDCKYPVVYAERGRAEFAYTCKKNDAQTLYAFMNQYILNQSDLSISLGVDYKDDEFGQNQVRKTEISEKDDEVMLQLVCSYPASYSLETMENALRKNCSDKIELKRVSNINPVRFEKDSYLVHSLEKAYEEIMEEDGSAVTTTGGTYAKVVKNIVPFGPSFKGQKGIGHLPNEWMRICDIEKNTQIYAYALYELMKGLK